jgi:predicted TIM-barrel fold metal-dependent hydrolase
MSELLTDEEMQQLKPAQGAIFPSPIPTHPISNGEFMPGRQTDEQRQVEARIQQLSDELAPRQGMSRRAFLRSSSGLAAAFLAMNDVYGPLFGVTSAEARQADLATERARRLSGQFIIDGHTHFLSDDLAPDNINARFAGLRSAVGKFGLNPDLSKEPQTLEHLKFKNYVKEMFLDSDTKIVGVSGAPGDDPKEWFLSNDRKAEARDHVNAIAGSRRVLSHAVFTPGQPGWLEEIDRCVEKLKPDAWKGYTIGDNNRPDKSRYPWRLDDEKVTYPGYEKMLKSGIRNVCVHKGLFSAKLAAELPHLQQYAAVGDVAKAAKDWPDLNFHIFHAGYRFVEFNQANVLAQFEKTGRLEWTSDLAEIPEKHGVSNVYADIGAVFAAVCTLQPRLAAAMLGTLVKGLGADKVLWGTDSLWFGSPQWQIEALRRLEIPEDMRKKHGYAPLGDAEGLVKSAVFGLNTARLFGINVRAAQNAVSGDRFAALKAEYERTGTDRSNFAYGWVLKDS